MLLVQNILLNIVHLERQNTLFKPNMVRILQSEQRNYTITVVDSLSTACPYFRDSGRYRDHSSADRAQLRHSLAPTEHASPSVRVCGSHRRDAVLCRNRRTSERQRISRSVRGRDAHFPATLSLSCCHRGTSTAPRAEVDHLSPQIVVVCCFKD